MPSKDTVKKMLIISMILAFGMAITSFINGVFSMLLKGGDNAMRSFYISLCFAAAGIIFRMTIKRQR